MYQVRSNKVFSIYVSSILDQFIYRTLQCFGNQQNPFFHGGSQQANSLVGKRVRNHSSISCTLFDPINNTQKTVDIGRNSTGIMANPVVDHLLSAYPTKASTPITTLEALQRSNQFFVIRINWATFRTQFEIEC